VLNSAVIGRPDERLDEVPIAFVEVREGHGLTAAELLSFCQGKIGRYKIPREIYFIASGEWPMSATKINKRGLRKILLERSESLSPAL
jgi:fatty-acyl-CoA synthase/long-chain acyl-CoA synthetase